MCGRQLLSGAYAQLSVKVFVVEFQGVFLDVQRFHDLFGGFPLKIKLVYDTLGLGQTGEPKKAFLFTYIPRSKKAVAEYGFDQSEMVLAELSSICGIEIAGLFVRKRQGKEQKKLTAEARAKNAAKGIVLAKGAEEIICGRSVILFDDIVSSGASMARATELLRRARVRNIFGISIAFND